MTDVPRTPAAIAFVSNGTEEAESACARLGERYRAVPPGAAEMIVALGGDGLMLQTLHRFMNTGKPIYGMNRGTVGFLMNDYAEEGLVERLATAEVTALKPLYLSAEDGRGERYEARAFNEVSLLRMSAQAAKLSITVDGRLRLAELVCDGIIVSTPQGSTAYNLSAHGPILPIAAPLLALTPISAFRPRRWRGALIPDRAELLFTALETAKRPVSAAADHLEIRDVISVRVRQDAESESLIMFDPNHGFDERILKEQFLY